MYYVRVTGWGSGFHVLCTYMHIYMESLGKITCIEVVSTEMLLRVAVCEGGVEWWGDVYMCMCI